MEGIIWDVITGSYCLEVSTWKMLSATYYMEFICLGGIGWKVLPETSSVSIPSRLVCFLFGFRFYSFLAPVYVPFSFRLVFFKVRFSVRLWNSLRFSPVRFWFRLGFGSNTFPFRFRRVSVSLPFRSV